MKSSLTILAFLATNMSTVIAADENNLQECVTDFQASTDYFPQKVEATQSIGWSVEYFNSYKVVKDIFANTTYLVYQCGTPPPDDISEYDAVLAAPLSSVGITSSVDLPFVELLGRRNTIDLFFGSLGFLYSPCLQAMIDDDTDDIQAFGFGKQNNATLMQLEGINLDIPLFHAGGDSPFSSDISTNTRFETENLDIFEWIKYFSVFFNDEGKANEIFESTKAKYDCVARNAGILSTDNTEKPTVLWAAWSGFCNGWAVAQTCPQFYCEFADLCQANILTTTAGNNTCGTHYLNTEQLVELGKDADYWIHPSPGAETAIFSTFKEELKDMKSVKNNQVYDSEGAGPGSWFEQRFAEPAAILQDFCSVVGTESNAVADKLTFLRHVDGTETAAPSCTDVNAPLLSLGSECSLIDDSDETTEDPDPTPGDSAASFNMVVAAAAVLVATAI